MSKVTDLKAIQRRNGTNTDDAVGWSTSARVLLLDAVRATLRLGVLEGDIDMFCPKCGETLEQVDGVWTCGRGGMQLSARLSAAFTDVYLLKIRAGKPQRATFRWGGVWYCPGCGVRSEEQAGSVVCHRCGQPLDEFLRALIELHPHKDVNALR